MSEWEKMEHTFKAIDDRVRMAGSLEKAISLVDEAVEKGKCPPLPKELRDEEIKRLWQEQEEARREFLISEIVENVMDAGGSLREAIRLVDEAVERGECPPLPKELRDERTKRSWQGERKSRKTFSIYKIIEEIVSVASSPEEARELIDKELEIPVPKEEIDRRIKSAWQEREGTERMLERFKKPLA